MIYAPAPFANVLYATTVRYMLSLFLLEILLGMFKS